MDNKYSSTLFTHSTYKIVGTFKRFIKEHDSEFDMRPWDFDPQISKNAVYEDYRNVDLGTPFIKLKSIQPW